MENVDQEKLKREEQENLDEIIERMDAEILRLNKNWDQKELDRKKQKDACLPDTYGALVDDNDDKYWIANKSKYIQQGRDELYGHRIEVHYADQFEEHEEGDLELRIGLHTYTHGKEIFICSWKRPVCRHYLLDNAAVEFVGTPEKGEAGYETVYTLKQKRQIKLDFDRVQEVIPLYFENATEETEKIISDEFLKELLERRSETEFKNIIFTIQKKQGEIIQKPFKQNIIVQGCAGSGKSMIMLHRLPILMYDNPDDLDLTNIYTITPSISYIQQAQNMLYQLEIADLPMGTIDQYYQYSLSKYRRKIEDCGAKISAEVLSPEREMYVYSRKCIDDINAEMKARMDDDTTNYQIGLESFSLQDEFKNQLSNKSDKTFSEKISNRLYICKKILNENLNVLIEYYKNIRQAVNDVQKLKSVLSEGESNALRTLQKEISKVESRLAKSQEEISKLDEEKNKKAIENRKKVIAIQEERLTNLYKERSNLDGDALLKNADKLSKELDNVLEVYADLKQDYGEYKTQTEFYNLISLREEFSDRFMKVAEELSGFGDALWRDSTGILQAFNKSRASVEKMFAMEMKYLDRNYLQKIIKSNAYLENLQKNLVMDIYKNILTKIGQKADKKGQFKCLSCSAYLYLQILYQYQGAPNAASESLITIDEAQNLSVEEFKLIKNTNNGNVVLDLFGDIKQHFEGTKGIKNWSDLSHVAKFQISDLNENYRNASQITEYCNRRFHTNMRAINWEGEGYKEYFSVEEYEDKINQILLHPHLGGISAIIVADRREANYIMRVFGKFAEKINNLANSETPINEAKWNLMTISQARGLEFRTVIAISGRMTQNQKYVAFTRALDKLYVFDEPVELSEKDMAVDEEKKKTSKEQKQTNQTDNKPKVKNDAKSNAKNLKVSGSEVKTFFENAGLKVVDERDEGGYLWVEGDRKKIERYINEAVDKYQISGRYATGKTLRSRSGWYTNTKK